MNPNNCYAASAVFVLLSCLILLSIYLDRPTAPWRRKKKPLEQQIIPLCEGHLQSVAEIEELSFSTPWTLVELTRNCLATRNAGLVFMQDEKVVGYLLYESGATTLTILRFAVLPDYRRKNIRRVFLQKVISKAKSEKKRLCIIVEVTDAGALAFLQSMGFAPPTEAVDGANPDGPPVWIYTPPVAIDSTAASPEEAVA